MCQSYWDRYSSLHTLKHARFALQQQKEEQNQDPNEF